MYYTIVWTNRYLGNKLISWLGDSFTTIEEAENAAKEIAHALWDEMPSLNYMILMHHNSWVTIYKQF